MCACTIDENWEGEAPAEPLVSNLTYPKEFKACLIASIIANAW